MKTRTKILAVLAVALIAGAWLARDQLRMLAYIPSIPTSQEAGIDFKTVVTPRTEDTACLAEGNGGTLAQEMLSLETLTVVVAHGENAMPVDVWESYNPDLPWIKNQNRNTLFDADCLTRSPDAPANCKGDDCAIMQDIGGYQWMDLAVVEAQDCFPTEAAGCSPGDEGVIARQVTRKCHYLIFNDEIYDLVDPAGNRYVMHATETGMPNLNASLPEGWTLERRTLDEPLVVSPVGGGDSCYQNVMRDNLEQGYHQYEFASQNHAVDQ